MSAVSKAGQAGDSLSYGGTHGVYKGRGVWVPPGMTAAEIFEGAVALTKAYDFLDHYQACGVVITVLETVRSLPPEAQAELAKKPG